MLSPKCLIIILCIQSLNHLFILSRECNTTADFSIFDRTADQYDRCKENSQLEFKIQDVLAFSDRQLNAFCDTASCQFLVDNLSHLMKSENISNCQIMDTKNVLISLPSIVQQVTQKCTEKGKFKSNNNTLPISTIHNHTNNYTSGSSSGNYTEMKDNEKIDTELTEDKETKQTNNSTLNNFSFIYLLLFFFSFLILSM